MNEDDDDAFDSIFWKYSSSHTIAVVHADEVDGALTESKEINVRHSHICIVDALKIT